MAVRPVLMPVVSAGSGAGGGTAGSAARDSSVVGPGVMDVAAGEMPLLRDVMDGLPRRGLVIISRAVGIRDRGMAIGRYHRRRIHISESGVVGSHAGDQKESRGQGENGGDPGFHRCRLAAEIDMPPFQWMGRSARPDYSIDSVAGNRFFCPSCRLRSGESALRPLFRREGEKSIFVPAGTKIVESVRKKSRRERSPPAFCQSRFSIRTGISCRGG